MYKIALFELFFSSLYTKKKCAEIGTKSCESCLLELLTIVCIVICTFCQNFYDNLCTLKSQFPSKQASKLETDIWLGRIRNQSIRFDSMNVLVCVCACVCENAHFSITSAHYILWLVLYLHMKCRLTALSSQSMSYSIAIRKPSNRNHNCHIKSGY